MLDEHLRRQLLVIVNEEICIERRPLRHARIGLFPQIFDYRPLLPHKLAKHDSLQILQPSNLGLALAQRVQSQSADTGCERPLLIGRHPKHAPQRRDGRSHLAKLGPTTFLFAVELRNARRESVEGRIPNSNACGGFKETDNGVVVRLASTLAGTFRLIIADGLQTIPNLDILLAPSDAILAALWNDVQLLKYTLTVQKQ
mmetsp:Transcript_37500/g.90462  ORF Transcript_37500/g.90462 Transcript_37500/m.90462 type:complete len:200 (-) Transcript_37500:655-1254(-)